MEHLPSEPVLTVCLTLARCMTMSALIGVHYYLFVHGATRRMAKDQRLAFGAWNYAWTEVITFALVAAFWPIYFASARLTGSRRLDMFALALGVVDVVALLAVWGVL